MALIHILYPMRRAKDLPLTNEDKRSDVTKTTEPGMTSPNATHRVKQPDVIRLVTSPVMSDT